MSWTQKDFNAVTLNTLWNVARMGAPLWLVFDYWLDWLNVWVCLVVAVLIGWPRAILVQGKRIQFREHMKAEVEA